MVNFEHADVDHVGVQSQYFVNQGFILVDFILQVLLRRVDAVRVPLLLFELLLELCCSQVLLLALGSVIVILQFFHDPLGQFGFGVILVDVEDVVLVLLLHDVLSQLLHGLIDDAVDLLAGT